MKNCTIRNCLVCKREFYATNGNIKKGYGKYCSHKCYAKAIKSGKYPKQGFQNGNKIGIGNKHTLGLKHTEETRKKMSEKIPWNKGINPNLSEDRIIRGSIEMKLWKDAVFARDNWTCQKTGIRGIKFNCHHICNFADYPELRTSIENGITLSEKSHREFHKIYGKKNNTREQLEEFLANNY